MASESLLFPLWLDLLENVSFYLMLLPDGTHFFDCDHLLPCQEKALLTRHHLIANMEGLMYLHLIHLN